MTGDHDYVLHFDADRFPPAEAFWSVTMYDDERSQVANLRGRFAVGDRHALTCTADGSLDLYVQHQHPGPGRESNWLPAPLGAPGITVRLYAPAPEALDGRWNLPAIPRIP